MRRGIARRRAQEYIRITIVVVDWAGRGCYRVPWLTGLVPVVALSYEHKLSASFR
jgi:hypothetical protein